MKDLQPLVLFALAGSLLAQTAPTTSVKLSLYYETICPDTRRFVLEQLEPTLQALGSEVINLELVPFGKATVHPDDSVTCQHDEPECYGNRLQGCHQSLYSSGIQQSWALVRCMYEKDNWQDTSATSTQCLAELSLPSAEILACTTGAQGLEIVKQNSAKTNALVPPLTYVPWIVIEDVHTVAMQDRTFQLLPYLCEKHLAKANLTACLTRTPVKLDLYYETLCPDTRKFVLEQLAPTFASLGTELLDIELVPYGSAKEQPDGSYVCPHGELECFGNKLQGCHQAVYSTGIQESVALVKCMFEKNEWANTTITSTQCSSELSLNANQLITCANGAEGLDIFKQNEAKTLALDPRHSWIPWIVINGVHTDAMVETDFQLLAYLCENNLGQNVAACKSGSSRGVAASTVTVVIALLSVALFGRNLQ